MTIRTARQDTAGPLSQSPQPGTKETGPPMPPRPLTILLADDNRDAVETLAEILRLDHHQVHTAFEGRTALALAQEHRPDIVLLDISMPELDGYTLCQRLRREPWAAGLVIVALSGYGSPQDLERGRIAGFDRYFTKPADPGELLDYLNRCAGHIQAGTGRNASRPT